MKKDALYVIGPGTTTRTIADLLDEKKTLLGVDLFLNKKNFYKDVNEKEIMKNIRPRKTYIIVTPIGGQGFILGRGNQQISSRIIKKVGIKNIIVVATKYKLSKLNVLRIDSESQIINKQLKGRIKVVVGYREDLLMNIE